MKPAKQQSNPGSPDARVGANDDLNAPPEQEDFPNGVRKLSEEEIESLADDVRWAVQEESETSFDGLSPLARLSSALEGYEITRELGRGGMGVVYEARQLKLGRSVALKVLPALLGAVRPDAIARFQREAELAAQFKHTNIIGVYDFGDVDGTLFYAMELIEGRTLRSILNELRETGTIDAVIDAGSGSTVAKDDAADTTQIGGSAKSDRAYFRQVAEWIAQIADALQYAHDRGVIHRDVKPSNLLVNIDGRMMLSDFGLARSLEEATLTRSQAMIGTARYMSPEQVEETGQPIDVRADVYGLGATFYELLTFQPMFGQADDRDVLHQVMHADPVRPSRIVSTVPPDLETICLKAVEKNRSRRFATAKDFADDLRRWLLGMPIHAKRPSAFTRTVKFIRRRPAVSVAALVTLLLVAAVASLVATRRQSAAHASAAHRARGRAAIAIATDDLRAGRDPKGLAEVEAALEERPDDPNLIELRALLLGRLNRGSEVPDLLEPLLERDPDRWRSHFILAAFYMDRPHPIVDRSPWANTRKAEHHRKELERLRPDSSEARLLTALHESDHRRSIELLTSVINDNHSISDALRERRSRYGAIGDYASMLLDAERLLARSPLDSDAHAGRGQALMYLNRLDEALVGMNKAIELNNNNAVAFTSRGQLRERMRDLEGAYADLSEAIRLNEHLATAYVLRGRVLGRMGRFDGALADIDRAIALVPDAAEAYAERATWHEKLGRWEACIGDATRAIELQPNGYFAYAKRGTAFDRLGKTQRAVVDYETFVRLAPDEPQGHSILGVLYAKLEQFDKALAHMNRAIDKQALPRRYDLRANYLFRLGRFDDAIADWTRVIDSVSSRRTVLFLKRGAAYEFAGQFAEAKADYEAVATAAGPAGDYGRLAIQILCKLHDCASDTLVDDSAETSADRAEAPSWPQSLNRLMSGDTTADELLALAATDDERAEAYYYIGCKALIDGKNDVAAKAFQSCVYLKRTGILETDFARARLERLSNDTSTIPSPASVP